MTNLYKVQHRQFYKRSQIRQTHKKSAIVKPDICFGRHTPLWKTSIKWNISPIITVKPSATLPFSNYNQGSGLTCANEPGSCSLFVSSASHKINTNKNTGLTGIIPLVKSVGYPYSLLLCVFWSTFWNSGEMPAAADTKAPAMKRDSLIVTVIQFNSGVSSFKYMAIQKNWTPRYQINPRAVVVAAFYLLRIWRSRYQVTWGAAIYMER